MCPWSCCKGQCWCIGHTCGVECASAAPKCFHRQVFSLISLPQLVFILVSVQLLKVNYRYSDKQTACSFQSILEVHQDRELYIRHEVGAEVTKVLLTKTNFFFQKRITSGSTFYFTKIRMEVWTFLRRLCLFHSEITVLLCFFCFPNTHNVNTMFCCLGRTNKIPTSQFKAKRNSS